LPPIGEQRSIVSAIDGDTIKLNDLILDTQKEIDLIREYQIRLIADIVTGQLDVGEVSRTLPAAVDAPELSVEAGAEDGSEELLEAVADHE
jgi:type I restriction enzyme S subunit